MMPQVYNLDLPAYWGIEKWKKGGQLSLSDSGCGCCSDNETLTLERLDKVIVEYEKAVLDLKNLREKFEEVKEL